MPHSPKARRSTAHQCDAIPKNNARGTAPAVFRGRINFLEHQTPEKRPARRPLFSCALRTAETAEGIYFT
jgi:hypothetical protein